MADITIALTGGGGDSSSTQYLKATLDKLNAAIDKLANVTQKFNTTNDIVKNNTNKPSPTEEAKNNNAWQQVGSKIGSILATAVGASLTIGIARYFNNQANAIMGRATATGAFGAAAISGNANNVFGDYASSLFSIERARRIANNNAAYESIYGLAGSAVGTVAGGAIGLLSDNPLLAAKGLKGGAAGGAAIGAAYGKEQAAFANAPIEIQMQIAGAIAKRRAEASISEWQTSFSRWGLGSSSHNVVPAAFNGGNAINVPLNKAFEEKYQNSQNYNAILNGIVPYLNRSPLDDKNGNLDTDVAQKFLKAGFAASDFARLTMQANQYQAISGQGLKAFADDIQQSHKRFGAGYDLGTNQTALNLLMLGYNNDEAKRIAYNSQFNPGMASSVSQYATATPMDYYSRQALSGFVGFNINASLSKGHIIGASASRLKQLQKARDDYFQKGIYDRDLVNLFAAGISPEQLSSLLAPLQQENVKGGKAGLGNGLSPGQSKAAQVLAQLNAPTNVNNMMVNASNVTILSTALDVGKSLLGEATGSMAKNLANNIGGHLLGFSPSQYGTNHSPAGK